MAQEGGGQSDLVVLVEVLSVEDMLVEVLSMPAKVCEVVVLSLPLSHESGAAALV